MIFDPLNRSFPLEWRHILLIAAGTVRVEGVIRPRADRSRTSLAFGMADLPVDAPLSRRFENRDEEWLLEIILQRAVLRYSLQVEPVMLQLSPGNTVGADDAANFALLVQTLCRQAPRAVVNRGAHFFREDREEKFRYPSRNAFLE